jgi:hypothetical protein
MERDKPLTPDRLLVLQGMNNTPCPALAEKKAQKPIRGL